MPAEWKKGRNLGTVRLSLCPQGQCPSLVLIASPMPLAPAFSWVPPDSRAHFPKSQLQWHHLLLAFHDSSFSMNSTHQDSSLPRWARSHLSTPPRTLLTSLARSLGAPNRCLRCSLHPISTSPRSTCLSRPSSNATLPWKPPHTLPTPSNGILPKLPEQTSALTLSSFTDVWAQVYIPPLDPGFLTPESMSEGNSLLSRRPTSTGRIKVWLTTSAFGMVGKWGTQCGLVAGGWAMPLEESEHGGQLVGHLPSLYPPSSPFLPPAIAKAA